MIKQFKLWGITSYDCTCCKKTMYSRIHASWHKRVCKKDRYARYLNEYKRGGDFLQRLGLRNICLYCGNVFYSKKSYQNHLRGRNCTYNKSESFKNKELRALVLYDKVFDKYDPPRDLIDLLLRRYSNYQEILKIIGEFATIGEWGEFRSRDIFHTPHSMYIGRFLNHFDLVKYEAEPISEYKITFGANQYEEPQSWTDYSWTSFYGAVFRTTLRDTFEKISLERIKPEYGSIYASVLANLKPEEAFGIESPNDTILLTDDVNLDSQIIHQTDLVEESIADDFENSLITFFKGKDDNALRNAESEISSLLIQHKTSKGWDKKAWTVFFNHQLHFKCSQRRYSQIMECTEQTASRYKTN